MRNRRLFIPGITRFPYDSIFYSMPHSSGECTRSGKTQRHSPVPAKSTRVLDVCQKCVLPELMRSIYSKWLRKGFFSLPRQRSHRKNASAAKPQEAVQADRHSSERKSLIFSIIPYSGHKTSMRACSGKSPPQTLQALKPYFSLYSVMVWYLSWVRVVYGHIDIPSSCSSLSTWEIRSADLAIMEAAPG